MHHIPVQHAFLRVVRHAFCVRFVGAIDSSVHSGAWSRA